MKGINLKERSIITFLSMFNLNIKKEDYHMIIDNLVFYKEIFLYNNNLDAVGKLIINGSNISIYSECHGSVLSAIGKLSNDDLYNFEYCITNYKNNKDYLSGSCEFTKSINYNCVFIKNKIDVYKDNCNIAKCIFNSLKNIFKISDYISQSFASYRNSSFVHTTNDKKIGIENDKGNITYLVKTSGEKSNDICGKAKCEIDTQTYDYSACEIEFRKIIDEYDPEYISLVNEQKQKINEFWNDLFQNVATATLKRFNKKQFKSMLNINTSKRSCTQKVKK